MKARLFLPIMFIFLSWKKTENWLRSIQQKTNFPRASPHLLGLIRLCHWITSFVPRWYQGTNFLLTNDHHEQSQEDQYPKGNCKLALLTPDELRSEMSFLLTMQNYLIMQQDWGFFDILPRLFPTPKDDKETRKKKVQRLCVLGVLKWQPESEWALPPFIVPKQNQTVWFDSDFSEVNKKIVRNLFPIPTISTVLQELEGLTYATALDLNMGYYTIRLDPNLSKIWTIIYLQGSTPTYNYQWALNVLQTSSKLKCQRWWSPLSWLEHTITISCASQRAAWMIISQSWEKYSSGSDVLDWR